MARYAERDCSDCGVIVPANELIPWQEKQLSGTTRRSGFRTGVRGGVGFSSGGSQRFRHVNLRLCADCADTRIEAARRARFWANVRVVVTFGAILAAIIAFINMKPARPTADNVSNVRSSNMAVDKAGSTKPITVVGDDRPVDADEDVQTQRLPDDQPRSDDEASRQGDTRPDYPSSPAASPPDDVGAAIAAATSDALETGRPQRWNADGKAGYVVPSAAQVSADRSCRNVYTTTIEGGTQTPSRSREWCWTKSSSQWMPMP